MPWTSRITIEHEIIPSDLVRQILVARGVTDVDTFLTSAPVDKTFFDQVAMLFGDQLKGAISAILDAVSKNISIVIHGDYDVDGVSATALLWETLYYEIGYENVRPFIPHRVDHGYGLSRASIDDIVLQLEDRGEKPGLLITVDCGITAKDSVEYASSFGFSVIVTDHHTRPEKESDLPHTVSTLHSYKLCGSGVSWVLSRGLFREFQVRRSQPFESADYATGTDLVALATLADIQELTEYNRTLVKKGLLKLSNTNRAGLLCLYREAGIVGKPIGVYEAGWVIAPRLNATGRLDHALDALRLLVVRDHIHARELAHKLDELNLVRQSMTSDAVSEAIEMVLKQWNKTSPIVVFSESWHEGIIGLIAGKLTEKFKIPTLAISLSNEGAKGSARSVKGIHIVNVLKRFTDLFETMGGHEQAAGFSLSVENVAKLKGHISLINLVDEFNALLDHVVEADVQMPIDSVSLDLCEKLSLLEPFGVGNEKPQFISRNVLISDLRTVGKTNSHLKLRFGSQLSEMTIDGIGFGLAPDYPDLAVGDKVDVLYAIEKNEFNGRTNVQVKVGGLQIITNK